MYDVLRIVKSEGFVGNKRLIKIDVTFMNSDWSNYFSKELNRNYYYNAFEENFTDEDSKKYDMNIILRIIKYVLSSDDEVSKNICNNFDVITENLDLTPDDIDYIKDIIIDYIKSIVRNHKLKKWGGDLNV